MGRWAYGGDRRFRVVVYVHVHGSFLGAIAPRLWVFIGCEAVAVGLIVLAFLPYGYSLVNGYSLANVGFLFLPTLALPFVSVVMLTIGYREAGILGMLTTLAMVVLLPAVASAC